MREVRGRDEPAAEAATVPCSDVGLYARRVSRQTNKWVSHAWGHRSSVVRLALCDIEKIPGAFPDWRTSGSATPARRRASERLRGRVVCRCGVTGRCCWGASSAAALTAIAAAPAPQAHRVVEVRVGAVDHDHRPGWVGVGPISAEGHGVGPRGMGSHGPGWVSIPTAQVWWCCGVVVVWFVDSHRSGSRAA